MTSDYSTTTFEPSASDIEAYNAMATIYENMPAAESRVARLNRLAKEHEVHVWFRWLTSNGKPQLTMMDNRPKVEPLPFNPGVVRVSRVYMHRLVERQQEEELVAFGLEDHVFELLPGVQVSAHDIPCAYKTCRALLTDGIHLRKNVSQQTYDAAQRRADAVARQLGIPSIEVDFPDEGGASDKTLKREDQHQDMSTLPTSRVRWVTLPVLDKYGKRMYQWDQKKGHRAEVTQRVAINVTVPRAYMSTEPPSLGYYRLTNDGKALLEQAINLGISNPRGRGCWRTATVIDLDGRKIGRKKYWDWAGPVLDTPYSAFEEQAAADCVERAEARR